MEELKAIGGEPVDIQPIAKAAKDATPKPWQPANLAL
jgi:hypothetical protein